MRLAEYPRAPMFRAPATSYSFQGARLARSFARVTASALLDLLQDLTEVVALWCLQRRELLVGQQVLLPQLLTDRQHVPVILEGGRRGAERAAQAHRRLLVDADRLLERIALDVLDQREVERDERQDPPSGPATSPPSARR